MFNTPKQNQQNVKNQLDKCNAVMGCWLSETSQKFSQVSQKHTGGMIRSNPFWHISKNIALSEQPDEGTIYLITQFFISNNPSRNEELLTSLKINCSNPHIDKIILINEREYTEEELGISSPKIRQIITGKRISYKSVFEIVENEKLDGYIVLSNLDIFFDKTIAEVKRTGISKNKGMFCLLRYEFKSNRSVRSSPICPYQSNSQDTWIWHSKFNLGEKERQVADFELGVPGCDNTFAYLSHLFGYEVYNLPRLIHSYHNHSTNIRSYNEKTEKTVKPYYYVLAPLDDNQVQDQTHPFTFIGENNNFLSYLEFTIALEQPFVVPRLAGIEHMYAVIGMNALQRGKFEDNEANYINQTRNIMKNNAGIFLPDANSVVKYSQLYLSAFQKCQCYIDWEPQGDVAGGGLQTAYEFITDNFHCQRVWSFGVADIFHLIYLEKPWTFALEGKRLLIISPFADTFKKQVKNLDKIYGRDMFPNCSFIFIKPPITNGNNSSRPFDEELDSFISQIEKIKDEFDIALVSCGGYGNPVVARIYDLDKSAIYVGGVLQMYFGVYGSRWERERPLVMRLFKNEYWVRPQPDERPDGFENVEQSCYW